MRTSGRVVVSVAVIALAFGLGIVAGQKARVVPAMWTGLAPGKAAGNLLELSRQLAGDGSWENIHVGRVYYLSGDKDKGDSIFGLYLGGKENNGDLIRIARVYAQAGDWDKAKPIFDRLVERASDDADWLVEIGAYYNLSGDRARAEELFRAGFAEDPRNLRNTLSAAGSYLGLAPRKR